jgi:hypothetical protein
MRKALVLALTLTSFYTCSAATAKMRSYELICVNLHDKCMRKCADDDKACDRKCDNQWTECLRDHARIKIRELPTNSGPANTKNIPSAGSATTAGSNTNTVAAGGQTITAPGPTSSPPSGAGPQGANAKALGPQGSGTPKAIQQRRNLRQN